MDIGELKDKLSAIQPYILNIKAILGIAIIVFAIYTAFNEIPKTWKKYTDAVNTNTKLVEEKNNLSSKEATLKAISKELDKLIVKIVEVQEGQSPELTAIGISQKIIELSEASQNIAGDLQPKGQVALNVDTAVQLPIAETSASTAPAAAQNTAETPAAPADAQATAGNSQNTLNGFKYGLSVSGNYASLAKFIHELALMKDFVMINQIKIHPSTETLIEQPEDKDKVVLEIEFIVPWQK